MPDESRMTSRVNAQWTLTLKQMPQFEHLRSTIELMPPLINTEKWEPTPLTINSQYLNPLPLYYTSIY